MRHALLAATVLSALVSQGCKTLVTDPGAYRAKKNVTIGYPGVLVNPSRGTGLGLRVIEPSKEKVFVNGGESGEKATSINVDTLAADTSRSIHSQSWGIDTFANVYPWDKSFFFFGVSAKVLHSRNAYSEHSRDFSISESLVNVEWIDYEKYVTFPFGITLNSTEGWTSMAGVGPAFHMGTDRRFLYDGESRNIDAEARDRTLKSFDSRSRPAISLSYLTGYSF